VSKRTRPRSTRVVLMIAVVSLVIAACGGGNDAGEQPTTTSSAPTTAAPVATTAGGSVETSAPTTAAPEEPLQKIVLGWTPGSGAPQIAVAIDQGIWKNAGLEVEVVAFPTGREALEALLGGQLDVATLAELPATTAAIQNQAFKVVTVLSRYEANKVLARRSAGIASLADLEGKRIGITLGTNMQFMAEEVLASLGAEAELVNVSPPDMVTALTKGDIDAAVTFPFFYRSIAEALGDDLIEFTPGVYKTNFVLGVSDEALAKRGREIEVFMQGIAAAETIVKSDPLLAQEATSRVVGENLPLDRIKELWTLTNFDLALDQELLDLMVSEGIWMTENGFVEGDPTPELFRSYFAESLLASVAPNAVSLP